MSSLERASAWCGEHPGIKGTDGTGEMVSRRSAKESPGGKAGTLVMRRLKGIYKENKEGRGKGALEGSSGIGKEGVGTEEIVR
jgi:hypothetical protein